MELLGGSGMIPDCGNANTGSIMIPGFGNVKVDHRGFLVLRI